MTCATVMKNAALIRPVLGHTLGHLGRQTGREGGSAGRAEAREDRLRSGGAALLMVLLLLVVLLLLLLVRRVVVVLLLLGLVRGGGGSGWMGGWVIRVCGRRVERGRVHGGRKKETCGRSLRARRRRKAEAERAGIT